MAAYHSNELFKLNQLLSILYSDDPLENRISNFLHQLASVIMFDKSAIYFFKDNGHYFAQQHAIECNLTSDYVNLNEYFQYYEQYDDLFNSVNNPFPVLFRLSDFYDLERRKENPAWKSFYIPSNVYYGINGNILIKSNISLKCGFCLFRNKNRNNFSDRDLEILSFFQPHMANALNYYGELSSAESSLLTVESQHLGFAIFDDRLKLISKNDAYEQLVSDEKYGKLLQDTILELCRAVRSDGQGLESYNREVKIFDAPFLIEVSKKFDHPTQKISYSCVIHDISYLFTASLHQLRERYMLTKREFDVLSAILDGLSNEEIAKKFYISIPSVKKSTTSIYSKLGIKNSKQILETLSII